MTTPDLANQTSLNYVLANLGFVALYGSARREPAPTSRDPLGTFERRTLYVQVGLT